MLSEKIKQNMQIYLTCLNSGKVREGDICDGVSFAKKPPISEIDLKNQPIYVLGQLAEDELLVSTGNQRYFFSLKDGWGVENNHLAAVSCGFFMDFGRSVTKEEIRMFATLPHNKKGTFSALAEQGRQEQLQKILSILK